MLNQKSFALKLKVYLKNISMKKICKDFFPASDPSMKSALSETMKITYLTSMNLISFNKTSRKNNYNLHLEVIRAIVKKFPRKKMRNVS